MSNLFDESHTDLLSELNHIINFDHSLFPNIPSEPYSASFDHNDQFADIDTSIPFLSEISNAALDAQTPGGFSPENSSNSNHPGSVNTVSQAVMLPENTQSDSGRLKMIAEPYYGTKLRYRSDFNSNDNRLGVLKNRTKHSSYHGPAIEIPKQYLNLEDQYLVRVSLVTVVNDKTTLRYVHPNVVENPLNEELNDRVNNSVCCPIQPEDCLAGIKSFPSLRIVKCLASELKSLGNLQVFDGYDPNLQSSPQSQLSSAKEAKKDYNLERSQLAFTIGKRVIINDQYCTVIYPDTTIFSAEMIEGDSSGADLDDDVQSSTEKASLAPTICRVYKYAPRYGFDTSLEDMVIFLTNKLEPRKYGTLKVTFECDIPNGRWSQPIVDLDIKDRMISFKTPIFPHPFDEGKSVDIILRQDKRDLGKITFFYLSPLGQCVRCQLHATESQTNTISNVSNKRSAHFSVGMDDSEVDGVVPVTENSHELTQSSSEPLQESSPLSTTVQDSTSLKPSHPPQTAEDTLVGVLATSVESLFLNNDYSLLLRICRYFINKRPQSLHDAVANNHHDLLSKFIPIASIDSLRQKNAMGETVLWHALRLNRFEILKSILEKKDSNDLLYDTDEKKNNIFHIMATASTSSEILGLIIHHLQEKLILLQEKFDQPNQDHLTPLQLSVSKNNLLVTKQLVNYFKTNVYELHNRTGDNLIHLAVRYGDLEMIKYLIEDSNLGELGNRSSLTMTPSELAQSLARHDIVEYLHAKYPQQPVEDDTSSSDDTAEE